MQKLSQEESLQFFLERQSRQQSPLDEGLSKLIAGTLDTDLMENTLRESAIPMTSTGPIQIPVPTFTSTAPPSFQGLRQSAVQDVPPQQWPANPSLGHVTAQTWNPVMSMVPRPVTQPTTQPQLGTQTWNPAMMPKVPQSATQPLTQQTLLATPMWAPTPMPLMQQPAAQSMMQQPATQSMMQHPATTMPMMQQPATTHAP